MEDNTVKFLQQAKSIEGQIETLRKTCYSIQNIEYRIEKIKKESQSELVSINVSNTLVNVEPSVAESLLNDSLQRERRYAEILMWRMDKAYSFLSGEFDKDMEQ